MKRLTIWMPLTLVAAGITLFSPGSAFAQGTDEPEPAPQPAPDGDEDAPPPPRRGGGGFGGGFGGFGQMEQGIERLTEELGLRPDQVEKLRGMGDGIRQQMMEGFMRMREEGFPDREQMRQQMDDFRKKIEGDIKGILDPEQAEKFQKMIDEQGGLFGGGNNFGQGGRGDRGGDRGRGRSPEERRKRRLEEIKAALILSEEEEAVIMPLVEKVMVAQEALRRFDDDNRRELTGFLKGGAETPAIEARLADFRTALKEKRGAVESAQSELLELLTLEQEAKLVAFGILP